MLDTSGLAVYQLLLSLIGLVPENRMIWDSVFLAFVAVFEYVHITYLVLIA